MSKRIRSLYSKNNSRGSNIRIRDAKIRSLEIEIQVNARLIVLYGGEMKGKDGQRLANSITDMFAEIRELECGRNELLKTWRGNHATKVLLPLPFVSPFKANQVTGV